MGKGSRGSNLKRIVLEVHKSSAGARVEIGGRRYELERDPSVTKECGGEGEEEERMADRPIPPRRSELAARP